MKTATGFSTVQTDETMRETISHGTSEYPFKFYDENMDMFDFRCIDWHWHSELEIMMVEKGSVDCYVGTEHFVLKEGNAIFVNSKVIHKFTSEQPSVIPNVLFSAEFIAPKGSLVHKKYVSPVLQVSEGYQIFCPDRHESLLALLREIFRIQKTGDFREILTVQKLTELWVQIFRNTDFNAHKPETLVSLRGQSQLQLMMEYIHENHKSSISLEQIAAAASVSKSTALKLFSKFLNDTPVNYLIAYRLKKAADLLKSTERKIDFIALETGFESDAYFCRSFKKHFGITPTAYRKTWGEN